MRLITSGNLQRSNARHHGTSDAAPSHQHANASGRRTVPASLAGRRRMPTAARAHRAACTGSPSTRGAMTRFAHRLNAAGIELIAIDLRGHGRSSGERGVGRAFRRLSAATPTCCSKSRETTRARRRAALPDGPQHGRRDRGALRRRAARHERKAGGADPVERRAGARPRRAALEARAGQASSARSRRASRR